MTKIDKIAALYTISENAKQYQDEEYIANDCYADNVCRKYPIHTKEACERSMAEYLYDNRGIVDNDSYIVERMNKAANNYNMEWPLACDSSLCNINKVSAKDGSDILEVEFTNTPDGVKEASEAVLNFRKTASYEPCKELAQGVVKAAFDHNCDIPDAIMRLAGYGVGTKDNAINVISKRANHVGNSEFCAKLTDMIDTLNNTPGDVLPPEELAKIASVLDAFDGLREDRGYTTYNTPPEQELFNKSAFDLVTILEDEMLIPSVGTVVSRKDIEKNASLIRPILKDMGIVCSDDNIADTVAGLSDKQANYLFGELE